MKIKLICLVMCVLIFTSCEYANDYSNITIQNENENEKEEEETGNSFVQPFDHFDERRLICRHTELAEFYDSIKNPREFLLNGNVAGGIVPHHLVAATLISGFFKAVAESTAVSGIKYDTVVIVAPNHEGETGDMIISLRDWQVWDTVFCDRDIVGGIYKNNPDGIGGIEITESDGRMEEEHSVSVLIPYINYYLPGVKVAPFLLNRRLTLETVYNFTKILSDTINASGKKVLFIGSIDFSHYLPAPVAKENDKITEAAVLDRNYRTIQEFSNGYVDSPQTLNTFLLYLKNIEADNIEILYNTDMSEFLGEGINETTSYFIIAAYES